MSVPHIYLCILLIMVIAWRNVLGGFGKNHCWCEVEVQAHSFAEFDAFSASVRDVDCTMMLQNAAQRLWTIDQVSIGAIDLQLGRLGSGNIVEGQSWSSGFLIYLPLSQGVQYAANGVAIGQHGFMVLEPGCEFCISTKFKHDWCSIFVPTEMVIGDDGPIATPQRQALSETPQCRVAYANRQTVTRFWSIVHETMVASANATDFEASTAAKHAEVELRRVVDDVLKLDQTTLSEQPGRPRVPRHEIVSQCRELIDARAGKPIDMEELVAKAAVSERTLRQAFYDYYGVGPVRYLQLRQLHQVYRALLALDPKTTSVGNVLANHGIWEFSRFAYRYRQLFAERPSDTLRKTRP